MKLTLSCRMSDKTAKKRISQTNNRDQRLLAEVKHKCPKCGKSLLFEKNGNTIRIYEKAHIYPHSPTEQQFVALSGITTPSDIESIDNLIALCKDCHKKYDSFTTKEEYFELSAIKQKLAIEYKLSDELADIQVENDILKVLRELDNMPLNDIETLRLDPIPIKKKINPGSFCNKVISNVMQFYPYLKNQFCDMDGKRTHRFAMIASEVKLAYQKACSETLYQEDIFNYLVDWLISKTLGTRASCEVVISFFIHDCEVFDALS